MALLAQRAFWRGLLRDTLQLNDILTSFKSMEAAEQVALSVYKRVLERYPQASMAGWFCMFFLFVWLWSDVLPVLNIDLPVVAPSAPLYWRRAQWPKRSMTAAFCCGGLVSTPVLALRYTAQA
jgi:hypothetical protein